MPDRRQVAPGPEASSHLPWEQQPGESDKAFAAFVAYRDTPAGDRSLRKVHGQPGGKRAARNIERWSSDHAWVARARAYDAMLDRERVAAARKAARDMAERHAKQAAAVQGVGMRDLQAIARQQAEAGEPVLHPNAALAYIMEGMRAERVARGEPGDVHRHELAAPDDPAVAEVVTDPDVQEAARELVRRAARAREGEPGGAGAGD